MKEIITVTYQGPIHSYLDDRIREGLESAGFEWYASGVEIETGIRDNSFYVPEDLVELPEGAE